MNHRSAYTIASIALGWMMLAAPSGAQTTANGPYYATPSWDQQLPVSTRFVVLSNWVDADFPSGGAAVLDRETGLVWERKPVGQFADLPWFSATAACLGATTGGRKGWRLPSIQELASLVDPSVASLGPTFPAGAPFILFSTFKPYWSATTKAYPGTAFEQPTNPSIGQAWTVDFSNGDTSSTGTKNATAFFWCVRGGGTLDSY